MKARNVRIGEQYLYYGSIPFCVGNKFIVTVLWVFPENGNISVRYEDKEGRFGQFMCNVDQLHNLHTKKRQKNKKHDPLTQVIQKYMASPYNFVMTQNGAIIVINQKNRTVLVTDGERTGKATCHEEDKFNPAVGMSIALERFNHMRSLVGLSLFTLDNLREMFKSIIAPAPKKELKIGDVVKITNPQKMALWFDFNLGMLLSIQDDINIAHPCNSWLNLGLFKHKFADSYKDRFEGKLFKIKTIVTNRSNNHKNVYMVRVLPNGEELVREGSYLVSGLDGLTLV